MEKKSTSLRIRPDFGGDMGGSPAGVSWDFASVIVGSVETEFVVVSTVEALLRAPMAVSLSLPGTRFVTVFLVPLALISSERLNPVTLAGFASVEGHPLFSRH